MYSMSMALTLASTLLAVVWLRRREPGAGIAYVAVSLAALHMHYFAAFIILAQNLYVLALLVARRLPARAFWRWLMWQAALLALYLPWLWAVKDTLTGYKGNGDSPGLLEALARAFAVFAAGETVPAWQGPVWAAAGVLAAGLGLIALANSQRHRPAAWLFGLYLGVPVLAAWYGAQARPIFDERYLAAAAPPFFALAACSLLPLVHMPARAKAGVSARVWGMGGAVARNRSVRRVWPVTGGLFRGPCIQQVQGLARTGAIAGTAERVRARRECAAGAELPRPHALVLFWRRPGPYRAAAAGE